MEQNLLDIQDNQIGFAPSLNVKPIKAAKADKWIVSRQSEKDAPNLFFTTDFRKFSRLTDIQPQKIVNWLTSELVTWQQLDGTFSQGVLYKPEDFDSSKKYPIIFNYYEKMSHDLYLFPQTWLLLRVYKYRLVCKPRVFGFHTRYSLCFSEAGRELYIIQLCLLLGTYRKFLI